MRLVLRPASAGRLSALAGVLLALVLPAATASARLADGVAAPERSGLPAAVLSLLPAAERGDTDAEYRLGTLYHEGRGIARSYTDAAWWWRKAATQGHLNAQFNLGVLYHQGQGIAQDQAEAARWWRKAALRGHVEAQYNLGLIYSTGRGVPLDQREAARWYEMAAEQGGSNAQYNLAVMYAKGSALPKDYVRAHLWFSLAADRAPSDELRRKAEHNRDAIASRLTPAQLDEAQRLAREWRPRAE